MNSVFSAAGLAGAWVGLLGFSFQIFFDFSAYSDMAIGIGHMLGFTLPENFNRPYRAQSLTEFFEKASAARAPDKEILKQFEPGDRVVNRRFGAGTVVKAEQGKNDLLVTVDFDKYGRKVMMAALAAFTRE